MYVGISVCVHTIVLYTCRSICVYVLIKLFFFGCSSSHVHNQEWSVLITAYKLTVATPNHCTDRTGQNCRVVSPNTVQLTVVYSLLFAVEHAVHVKVL